MHPVPSPRTLPNECTTRFHFTPQANLSPPYIHELTATGWPQKLSVLLRAQMDSRNHASLEKIPLEPLFSITIDLMLVPLRLHSPGISMPVLMTSIRSV